MAGDTAEDKGGAGDQDDCLKSIQEDCRGKKIIIQIYDVFPKSPKIRFIVNNDIFIRLGVRLGDFRFVSVSPESS